MSRVSVSAGQKPKPKNTFKFLRRDEGRLSYSQAAAEAPVKNPESPPAGAKERRDSKALREAIAFDMRNAKSHDPLGEVVVAVPKKAPPPNRSAVDEARSQTKRQPIRGQSKARPEWVDPDIPVRPVDHPQEASPSGYGSNKAPSFERDPPAEYDALYRDAPNGDYSHAERGAPRRAPSASASRRYADPERDDYDRNYFRRPPPPRDYVAPSASRTREEEDLMIQLEQEVRAAQEERSRYTYAKQQLDREKQRFEAYKFDAQQQIDDDRADLEAVRAKNQHESQKSVKSLEERYKNVSQLLSTEREANRKLMQENEYLRTQLDDVTAAMRDLQKSQKSEAARLRREIESLQRRNADLLAMAKEQQLQQLDGNSPMPSLAIRERSKSPADDVSPLEVENVSAKERADKMVLDFTPRSSDPSKERRAREMEERMRREEEDMQQRRQQREREAAERRMREEEDAVKEAARKAQEAEMERQRVEAEKREAAARRRKAAEEAKAKTKADLDAKEAARKEREEEAARRAQERDSVSDERAAAGHPMNTPRGGTGKSKANRAAASNSKAPPTTAAASQPERPIPTKDELVGSVEAAPVEEFPDDEVVSQTSLGDHPNKKEILYRSGKREIHYVNGTTKVVLPSSHTILHFSNGDVKCTFPSGKSTYWYDAAQTTHTQMPDGVQIFEFHSTGQTERHLPDGTKKILYPDGIFKIMHPDGTDETLFPGEQS